MGTMIPWESYVGLNTVRNETDCWYLLISSMLRCALCLLLSAFSNLRNFVVPGKIEGPYPLCGIISSL